MDCSECTWDLLDFPLLLCTEGGIKDMDRARGVSQDALLKGGLPIRTEGVDYTVLALQQGLNSTYLQWGSSTLV